MPLQAGEGVGGGVLIGGFTICFIIPLLRHSTILGQKNAHTVNLRRSVRFLDDATYISKTIEAEMENDAT